MKQLSYTEEYSRKSFNELLQALGNKQDNYIELDADTGEGSVRLFDIDRGLQLRIWDCTFYEGLAIDRAIHANRQDKTFTLIYYITPEAFELESCDTTRGKINAIWNTVFLSSDACFRVKILPGKRARCISLNFTPDWLRENVLSDITIHNHLVERYAMMVSPFVLFESYSSNEKGVVEKLFEEGTSKFFGKFFLRSKTLNILTEFFSKIVGRLSLQSGNDLYHEEQIAEVERQLVSNIHDGFPDIKKLAGKLSMSESTLKRYFKRIYGKNIYSYFLEKKMILARKLLEEKQQTVSEVAYSIGYENVSQFSNMFRKFYGILPGSMRKISLSE